MSRIFAAFLLIVVLAIGGSAIAAVAYQAGLTTAVTQVVTDGSTVVAPVVVPSYAYGWGWGGPGFGFLGFLGTILFLFLVFGLLRAIFGGGRRRGHEHGWSAGGPGWGGPGWGGPGWGGGREAWQARAHDGFDTWHREAHAAGGPPGDPGDAADSGRPPA